MLIDKAMQEIQDIVEKYNLDAFCMLSAQNEKQCTGFVVNDVPKGGSTFIQYMNYFALYSDDERFLSDLALLVKRWSVHHLPSKANPIHCVTVFPPVGEIKYEHDY